MEKLREKEVEKIKEQKRLAVEFNELMGALNEDTRQTIKNLEAAIAVNGPSLLKYREMSPKCKEIVNTRRLDQLTKHIASIDVELKDIRNQIANESKKGQSEPPVVNSMADWFAIYGKPNAEKLEFFNTKFSDSPKIYGGTKHYASFKSKATTMKIGKMTR